MSRYPAHKPSSDWLNPHSFGTRSVFEYIENLSYNTTCLINCPWDVPTKTVWCLWDGGTHPHHVHGKFLPVFLLFHGCKVGICWFWPSSVLPCLWAWPGSVLPCLWAWPGGSQMPILRIDWFLLLVSRGPPPRTCVLVL